MLLIEPRSENIVKIHVLGKLAESDFRNIAPQVEQLIAKHGHLRLLLDVTAFEGWAGMNAARQHFIFVRDHQQKIERIAVIASHAWQHWVAGIASVFVHPEIKMFDKEEWVDAEVWLRQVKPGKMAA